MVNSYKLLFIKNGFLVGGFIGKPSKPSKPSSFCENEMGFIPGLLTELRPAREVWRGISAERTWIHQ